VRSNLKMHVYTKAAFTGEFVRYGLKNAPRWGKLPTMLLEDLVVETDGQKTRIDHVWVAVGKTLARLNAREGAHITFNAWFRRYDRFDREFWVTSQDIDINRVSAPRVFSNGEGYSFYEFWADIKSVYIVTNKLDDVVEEIGRRLDATDDGTTPHRP